MKRSARSYRLAPLTQSVEERIWVVSVGADSTMLAQLSNDSAIGVALKVNAALDGSKLPTNSVDVPTGSRNRPIPPPKKMFDVGRASGRAATETPPVADNNTAACAASVIRYCTAGPGELRNWQLLPASCPAVVSGMVAITTWHAVVTETDAVAVTWFVAKPIPLPVANTVMVAVPGATPVTTPLAFTIAMLGLLVVYVYDTATAALALAGVGVSWTVCPAATEGVVGASVTPFIAFGNEVTVTSAVAVRAVVVKPEPLPVAVTVIVALPGATPVTTPVLALTVATLGAFVA